MTGQVCLAACSNHIAMLMRMQNTGNLQMLDHFPSRPSAQSYLILNGQHYFRFLHLQIVLVQLHPFQIVHMV